MEISDKKRLLVVWLVLVAITVIYLWIDHTADDGGVLVSSVAVTVSAIGLALVKFRIIMREFMDVRHAPPLLRRLTDLLAVVIAVSLLSSYLVGRAVAEAGPHARRMSPSKPVQRGPEPTEAQWRVINAALKLFAHNGVGGTSLRMIATELGVTVAAVYHQYNTKDEIIYAAAESELRRLEAPRRCRRGRTHRR